MLPPQVREKRHSFREVSIVKILPPIRLLVSRFTANEPWTRERLLSLAPGFVSVVLGIALAAQCVVLVRTFLPSRAGNVDLTRLRVPTVAPRPASIDVQSIVRANLFGVREPEGVDASNAPVTQQPLVLTATFAMPDSKQGYAILGDSMQSARLYSVGASVAGGAILTQVFSDRVILNRGGTLETLQLPRNRGTANASDTSPAARIASISTPASNGNSADQGQIPSPAVKPFMPFPDFRGGHYHGMRVTAVRDADRVAQMGLQPGDVITEVNGTPLTNPQIAGSLMRGLGTTQLNVTIERGGQSFQAVLN
jgi:general secretion pathway protein C